MKINFDNWNQNPNIEQVVSHHPQEVGQNPKYGAYSYEKSVATVDNNAYGERGKSWNEMLQELGVEADNLSVKRDAMTVLSNIMSTEDFNKMMEDGFDPSKLEPEQVVTIVDHIKAEMAKSGKVVSGYNDDLSREKLTEILGSSARAGEVEQALKKADLPVNEENVLAVKESLDKADKITNLDDAGKKYMLENHLDPTIENIYRAGFSAYGDGTKQSKGYFSQEMPGYYAKKADVTDYKAMEPQIEKSIEKMNLGKQTKEESMEQAKWLISKGIPVTEYTMQQLGELLTITFPLDEKEVIQASVNALAKGKPAAGGNLGSDTESIYEQANRYLEETAGISEEAVMETVSKEQEINLKNLNENQKRIISGEIGNERVTELSSMIRIEAEVSVKFVHASRTLAEVQLRMSVDANIRLLKSDFAIDTMPLSELVEALKKQEEELAGAFFGKENSAQISEKTALFRSTETVLSEIPFLPAAVIGRVRAASEISLTTVHTEGVALRAAYQAAGISYETLMTAPRADLGDSIKKAFGNVDDILQDMGLERSEDNRKAVRILGYNNTAITEEALTEVRETCLQVENVVKAMSPQRTLAMIRDGVNPLTMELGELEQYLNQMERTPEEETSKYARYLYELEKNGQITEAERGAYIGIYRVFHQIEKSDGAVIGSVMNQGADLTLGNLLTAVRSKKAGRMDYSVDDGFGMLSEVNERGNSISGQIERGIAQAREAKAVFRDLSVEALQQMGINEEMTITQIRDGLAAFAQEKGIKDEILESDRTVAREMLHNVKQDLTDAAAVDARIFEILQKQGAELTPEMVLAAKEVLTNKGSLIKQAKRYAEKGEQSSFSLKPDSVTDHFNDYESAQETMENWENSISTVLQEALHETAETTVDVRTLSLGFKQVSMISSLRRQESYEVPMEINGEITSVNVTLVQNAEEKGTVSIMMDTEYFGKAGVRFKLTKTTMESYFVAESEMGKERLESVGAQILDELEQKGFVIGNTNYVNMHSQGRKGLDFLTFSGTDVDNNSKTVATAELYNVAKTFLKGLQRV